MVLALGSTGTERARVAVLPVQSHATLPESLSTELRETIERGLRRAEVELVGDQLVDDQLDDEGCQSARCAAALARAVEVAWILRPTITEIDSVYEVRLEAIDEHGRSIASADERCEICGYREVSDLVLDRSAALGAKVGLLQRQAPRLQLRSSPSGAEVWIDGRRVGRTPLERELAVGEHELRLKLPGYLSEHRRIAAVAGTEDTVSFTMAEDPQPRRRPWLGVGVASLATGTAMLGTGLALVAIDEREYERDCNPDPLGHCSQRYDTLAGGVAVVASAGVLVVTGVIALVVDRRTRRRTGGQGAGGQGSHDQRRWGVGRGVALAF